MNIFEKENILKLCREFLKKEWLTAGVDDVIVEKQRNGFANKTYLCALVDHQNKTVVTKVIVKLYGSELVGKRPAKKVMGDAGELLVICILNKLDLAPKLYATFEGGRIEQFIECKPADAKLFESSEIVSVVARKIARFHKLQMPLVKEPAYFDKLMSVFVKSVPKQIDLSNESETNKYHIKQLLDFPLTDEVKWISLRAPKIGSRVVFSHNDLIVNNIVVRNNYSSIYDKIYFMDYETCAYNYRGFDVAFFIQCKHFELIREREAPVLDYFRKQATNDEIDEYLKSYLIEWKIDNHLYCPDIDSLRNLRREVHFFGLQQYLFHITAALKNTQFMDHRWPPALGEYFVKLYRKRKRSFIETYGDPNKIL